MRKVYLIPLFLLLLNLGFSTLTNDDILVHYSFDETSGIFVNDSSVNGLNMTMSGTYDINYGGEFESSLYFTGNSEGSVSNVNSMKPTSSTVWSMSHWIEKKTNITSGSSEIFWIEDSVAGTTPIIRTGITTAQHLEFAVYQAGWKVITFDYMPPLNEWNMITLNFNGSYVDLYVNSVFTESKALSLTLTTGYTWEWAKINTGGRSRLAIDELYLFNGKLTQDNIDNLYEFNNLEEVILNKNVTNIRDNTTWLKTINGTNNYIVPINSTNNFLFTALNSSDLEVSQYINISCSELDYNTSFMSGTNISLTFDNSINNNTCMVINPYNTSVNYTFYVINENLTIQDNTTYHILIYNLTNKLKFNLFENYNQTFFNDRNFNLNISQLGINQNYSFNDDVYIHFDSNDSLINASITYLNDSKVNLTTQFYLLTMEEFLSLNNGSVDFILLRDNIDIVINNTDLILNNSYTIIEQLNEINGTTYSILNNTYQILINLANGFNNLTNWIELQFNNTFSYFNNITDTLFNINYTVNNLNVSTEINESTLEDISLIKKIQICYFKQYETIDDYYNYCLDYSDRYNLTVLQDYSNTELNITAYFVNKSLNEWENTNFNGDNCYNIEKYKYLLNLTDYFILNSFLTASSISIDSAYCWLKLGFKTVASVKV